MKATNLIRNTSRALLAGLLLATPAAWADYQSEVLSQGPVGYWRLNDTVSAPSPILATNLGGAGAGANGAFLADVALGLSGALPSQPGSTAARFPGYLDRTRVSMANNNALWSPAGSFSVEFWAKPGRTTGGLTCPAAYSHFLTTPTTRRGWLFYQGSLTNTAHGWSFRVYTNAADPNSVINAGVNMTLDTNSWYHVVGVYNAAGPSLALYTNGGLATNVALPGVYAPVLTNTVPMTLGCRSDNGFAWLGTMDEPAFYSFALSDTQIAAHYQAGTNAAPATSYNATVLADTPVGYWRLDETYGPAAANLGSSGTAGTYSGSSVPGVAGPTLAGFEAGNKAVSISSANPGSVRLAPLNLNTNAVTITAWVKPNGPQNPYAGIVFQWANIPALTYSGLMMGKDGVSQLGYTWNNDPTTYDFASPITLTDNQWSFVAMTVSPNEAKLYAHDGTALQTAANTFVHVNQPFSGVTHIGMDPFDPASATFNGAIDEVAVFNRTLNAGEIYSLYSAAKEAVPPTIFQDPVAPLAIFNAETLTLSVVAGGSPALAYQWRKGGSDIAGATSSVYTKANITLADGGNYDVVVTNAFGSVTSAGAFVTVGTQVDPTILVQPVGRTVYKGALVKLEVGADGGNLKYQWKKDGVNLAGATQSAYTLAYAQGTNSGNYSVVITNSINTVTSDTVTLTVIVPAAGSYAETIVGDLPISWWRLDEPAFSGTFADSMGRYDGTWVTAPTLGAAGIGGTTAASFVLATGSYGEVPYTPELNGATISVECWVRTSNTDATLSPLGSWASFPNYLGYMFLKDGTQWRSAISRGNDFIYTYVPFGEMKVNAWTHLVFTCNAGGSWTTYINGVNANGGSYNPAPWLLNTSAPFRIGVNVPGSSTYGNFFDGEIDEVAVYNKALAATNVLAHYIAGLYGNNTKPIFVTQPGSRTVVEGTTVALTAVAEGTPVIRLQWFKDSLAIANATNTTLNLPNVTFGDAAIYTAMATNSVGSTTSAPAVLTVVGQPTFANVTNNLVLHLKFDGTLTDSTGSRQQWHTLNTGTAVYDRQDRLGRSGDHRHHADQCPGRAGGLQLCGPGDSPGPAVQFQRELHGGLLD